MEYVEKNITTADLIINAAKELDINTRNAKLLSFFWEYDIAGIMELLKSFIDESGKKEARLFFENSKDDINNYRSCLATSRRLFNMFADKIIGETKIAMDKNMGEENIRVMKRLTAEIKASVTSGAIFRIVIGGHSFTIIARENRAELIQSYANRYPIGESLNLNMRFDNDSGKLNDLLERLKAIVYGNERGRIGCQRDICGYAFEDESDPYPFKDFKYESASLKNATDINATIKNHLKNQTKTYDEIVAMLK